MSSYEKVFGNIFGNIFEHVRTQQTFNSNSKLQNFKLRIHLQFTSLFWKSTTQFDNYYCENQNSNLLQILFYFPLLFLLPGDGSSKMKKNKFSKLLDESNSLQLDNCCHAKWNSILLPGDGSSKMKTEDNLHSLDLRGQNLFLYLYCIILYVLYLFTFQRNLSKFSANQPAG